MRIFSKLNVFDAAKERIRFLFDEFSEIVVCMSGGKDSTVTLELAIMIAAERGRLPLKVFFLDQEAEWQYTIDYVREVMNRPEVTPVWLQVPFRIFNAASTKEAWLHCWEPEKEDIWMRPREPDSIHDNRWGVDRFHDFFPAYFKKDFAGQKVCYLAGVRAEESMTRYVSLTTAAKYKYITYGKRLNPPQDHYTFYPIYDWGYRDVWKAIHDHHWPYCQIYDYMYRYGTPVQEMRVSNVTHETAVRSLYMMQEVEPETWRRLQARLRGINTAKVMQEDAFRIPEALPPMFGSWKEYRDYLLRYLTAAENQPTLARQFHSADEKYKESPLLARELTRIQLNCILRNDYHGTRMATWQAEPEKDSFRKFKKGIFNHNTFKNKYVLDAIKHGYIPPTPLSPDASPDGKPRPHGDPATATGTPASVVTPQRPAD